MLRRKPIPGSATQCRQRKPIPGSVSLDCAAGRSIMQPRIIHAEPYLRNRFLRLVTIIPFYKLHHQNPTKPFTPPPSLPLPATIPRPLTPILAPLTVIPALSPSFPRKRESRNSKITNSPKNQSHNTSPLALHRSGVGATLVVAPSHGGCPVARRLPRRAVEPPRPGRPPGAPLRPNHLNCNATLAPTIRTPVSLT